MRPPPKPGFWLVAKREWRWIRRHHLALILIFGVPLFAFAVLTGVFSHPVIRGLGVVVVDADRSDTSRAFVEQVAVSPSLSIVERAGDLASAARAIRGGDAIMIKGSLGSRMGPIVKALQHLSARQNMSETGASRNGTLRAASAQG